jgi:hypothetical protein
MAVYKQSSLGHGAGVANITVTITPTAGNNIYTLAGCNSVSTAMSAGAVTDNKSQTHTSAGDSRGRVLRGRYVCASWRTLKQYRQQ